MRKPLPAIAFLALASVLYATPLVAQGVCPVSDQFNPQSASKTLNVPRYESYRPLVAADYVVIEYNASQKKPAPQASDSNAGLMSWTDYKGTFDHRGTKYTTYLIGLVRTVVFCR